MALISISSLWGLPLVGMPLVGMLYPAGPLSQEGPGQEGPAAEARPADPQTIEDLYGRWVPMNQVVIVVNGDIITQLKIKRKIDEKLAGVSNTTPDQFRGVVAQIQEEEVESLLVRQAGEDLGLPPEAVEAHVSGTIRDDLDKAGGAFALAEKLRADDTTALELKQDRTTEIYESSWRRKIAGMGGGQERSSEDRYIRPGHLAQRYLRIQRTGRDIEYLRDVGAVAATYEFQLLLITPQGAGTIQEAAKKIEQAHNALTGGQADWEDLIATLGELGQNGLTGPILMDQIEIGLDPGNGSMLEFAMSAEPGSLSQIMQFPEVNQATGERRLAGFAIYKLLGRTDTQVPDYSAGKVQFELRRYIQREADKTRWEDALTELKRTAYIWHPDVEAQNAQRREALARRNQEIQKARDENAARFRAAEAAQDGEGAAQP